MSASGSKPQSAKMYFWEPTDSGFQATKAICGNGNIGTVDAKNWKGFAEVNTVDGVGIYIYTCPGGNYGNTSYLTINKVLVFYD